MRWRGCPSQSPSACGHGPCPEATKTRRWRRPHQSCLHLQGGTSEDLSARSRVRPLGFDPATASQVSPGAGEMHRRRGDDDGASYARRRWFVPSPPERASRGCSLHIGSGSRRLGFVAGEPSRGAVVSKHDPSLPSILLGHLRPRYPPTASTPVSRICPARTCVMNEHCSGVRRRRPNPAR
jgi:hypothetical protein